jgi:hypothetical protein
VRTDDHHPTCHVLQICRDSAARRTRDAQVSVEESDDVDDGALVGVVSAELRKGGAPAEDLKALGRDGRMDKVRPTQEEGERGQQPTRRDESDEQSHDVAEQREGRDEQELVVQSL